MVIMPEDEGMMTNVQRGSVAPERGERLRVRGEITRVVENQFPFFNIKVQASCRLRDSPPK
jgi:hypothetical protein